MCEGRAQQAENNKSVRGEHRANAHVDILVTKGKTCALAGEYTVQKKKQAQALTLRSNGGGLHKVRLTMCVIMALRWTQQMTVRRMWRMQGLEHRTLWTAPSPVFLPRRRSSCRHLSLYRVGYCACGSRGGSL